MAENVPWMRGGNPQKQQPARFQHLLPKKLRISSTDMVEMVTTEGMASLATATTASLSSALAVTLTVLVWGMLSSSAAMLPPR